MCGVYILVVVIYMFMKLFDLGLRGGFCLVYCFFDGGVFFEW